MTCSTPKILNLTRFTINKKLTAVAMLFAISLSATAQQGMGLIEMDGKKIEISGAGHKQTVPCAGRDLIVAGSDHVIATTGMCGNVDVSGSNNSVTVAMAPNRKLIVAGSEHLVSTTGATSHADISGGKNTVAVEIASKGTLEVAGANHVVNWKSVGDPMRDISGAEHKITRLK